MHGTTICGLPRITRRVALQAATSCVAAAVMPAHAERRGVRTAGGQPGAARLALAIAQLPRRPVDPEHAERDLARNVDRLLEVAAEVQAGPVTQGWIAFPSGALNGWDSWDGRTAARIAIDPHGPEARRLIDAARSLRCTLSIGALIRSPRPGGAPVDACGLFDPQRATARWAALAPDGTVTLASADPSATALVLQMTVGPRDTSSRCRAGAGSAEVLAAAQRAHFVRVECATADPPPGAPRCGLGAASCIVDARGRRLATARGTAQQVVASTLA
jgi:hypothetical protein